MTTRARDLIGRRFGRLATIKHAGPQRCSNGNRQSAWLLLCDCGKETTVLETSLLRPDGTKSCGCRGKRLTPCPSPVAGATWIPLTKGEFALVDNDDVERVTAAGLWSFHAHDTMKYARSGCHGYLHRFVMRNPLGYEIDHINRDGLDCRKANLRLATKSQQQANAPKKRTSTSRWKGIYRERRRKNYWVVRMRVSGRVYYRFAKSEEAAAMAYNELMRQHFGEYALLNEVGAYARSA